MRTVRSSGRISGGSAPGGGGCLLPGGWGVCSGGRGVCSRREFGCLLWGVSARGVCLLWGGVYYQDGSAPREVCSGGCLLSGGVCSRGVSALGGGVSALGGGGIPPCTEADTPSPCGQTDACKNITFATSLRTVKTALTF